MGKNNKKYLVQQIFQDISNYIKSDSFLNSSKKQIKDFTRKRLLDFEFLILFIINFRNKSTQSELNDLFKYYDDKDIDSINKTTFFKARKKIKETAFSDLLDKINEYVYKRYKLTKRWKDFRLVACDGANITIPGTGDNIKDDKLIDYFGVRTNDTNVRVIQGHAVILYDVMREIIISGNFKNNKISERELLYEQLDKLEKNDLLLLDRGFPAVWLFILLSIKNIQFVNRLPSIFLKETNDFFKSNELEKIIEIKIRRKNKNQNKYITDKIYNKQIKIRLVKVYLDDGEVEVLATSLLDEKKYPYEIFKDLYFKRWPIETNINVLKNKLQTEYFSGKSIQIILQDFYAKLIQKNFFSLIKLLTQDDVDKINKKRKKYKYKINENITYGLLKHYIVKMLRVSLSLLEKLAKKVIKFIEPIRNNRKYLRIKKVKSKSTIISYANRIAI